MPDINPQDLTDRYVALWNEPDADVRRDTIRELWAEEATHVLQPPQDIRQAAEGLGFAAVTLETRGYAALEFRVTRAHEEFVAPGTFTFSSRRNADRLHDIVKFNWEMVSSNGEVAGVGLEILVLDQDGRIRTDYQFIEG